MNKKIVSIFAMLALLILIIPINAVYAQDKDFTVTITPDKSQIDGGKNGEISYKLSLESKIPVTAIELRLDIPEGMEYVSGEINEDARVKFSKAQEIGDNMIQEYSFGSVNGGYGLLIADETPRNIEGKVDVATFKCKITDTSKADEYTVGLNKFYISDADIERLSADRTQLEPATTKVVINATGITLNKSETTIQAGKTEQLKATLIPENALDKIVWKTSDTQIADVDQNGLVTAKKVGGPVTITVQTENGKHFATCKITVECAHEKVTVHPETESTCKDHGYTEYTTCDLCGKIVAGEKIEKPLVSHTFGKLIPKKEAVHGGENGIEAHYVCTVCGKLFKEDRETETTEDELEIKDPHVYGDDWKFNEENHWKECGCGNKINEEQHHGGEATCTKLAVCEVCGTEYGEVNLDNHVNKEVRNAVEATCDEEGYTGDVYCLDCGAELEKGTKIDPLGHKGGKATCTKLAVCEVCGAEYGEVDPNNHVNTEIKGYIEATAEKEGYTGDTYCVDCEKLIKLGEVIPIVEEKVEMPEEDTKKQDDKIDSDLTIKVENTNRPDTNDISNIALWISLFVISGSSIVGIVAWNLKKIHKIINENK